MQKLSRSIYQTARNSTDLTQEGAAELLCISVESLRAYERKATVPPADIVLGILTTRTRGNVMSTFLKIVLLRPNGEYCNFANQLT